MIFIPCGSVARCDHDDAQCAAEVPVKIILGLAGGLMFDRDDTALWGWQLMVCRTPGQPVLLLCPEHNRTVDTAGLTAISLGRKPVPLIASKAIGA
jgi:hypothetical protein